jgi:hypothetical protein
MSLLQEMQTHGLAECSFNQDLLKSKVMTYEQWEAQYQPILNHLDHNAIEDQRTFETYGVEVGFVLGVNFVDPRRVWTLIDGEKGAYIVDGYRLVNRILHYVTQKPYEGQQGAFEMLDYEYLGDEEEDHA